MMAINFGYKLLLMTIQHYLPMVINYCPWLLAMVINYFPKWLLVIVMSIGYCRVYFLKVKFKLVKI